MIPFVLDYSGCFQRFFEILPRSVRWLGWFFRFGWLVVVGLVPMELKDPLYSISSYACLDRPSGCFLLIWMSKLTLTVIEDALFLISVQ